MSKTAESIINRVGLFMGDTDDVTFTRAQKLAELNEVITGEVSSRTLCYARDAKIQVVENEMTYQFPSDMLELKQITMTDISGEIILPTSYSYLVRSESSFNRTFLSNPRELRETQFGRVGGEKIFFRDLSSDNEFIFDPTYDGENLTSGTVYRQADVPDNMAEDDVWVDTYNDQNLMWQADASYAAGEATLTVEAADLPGTTDLVFSSIATGTQRISVSFIDGGASGTSSLATSGSSTREDPLVYAFTLFDDDNDNDAIIALLSGDSYLTATGSDSTSGASMTHFSATALTNVGELNLSEVEIHIQYYATLPPLSLEADTLHPSIPTLLRTDDGIAYLVAANLIEIEDGGDLQQAERFKRKADDSIDRATRHTSRKSLPGDVRPV